MTPKQFKDQRQKLGLTQAQTAQALGLSITQVQNYEYGNYPVPFTVCFTLIHLTKKDIKNLLTRTK